MKKLMMLILGVLLFIPAVVFADMGAPGVREYKVTPKSQEGAAVYDIYSGQGIIKIGTVAYGQEVAIVQEFEVDGIIYGYYYDDNMGSSYIKLSEFKVAGESSEKDEALYAARVFAEDGLELYAGPAYAYEKTGKTVAKGTTVAASDFIGSGTWVYIENGDAKGYVNAEKGGLGILYKKDVISRQTNKEYSSFYQLDSWSRAIMVKDGESYIKLYQGMSNSESPGYSTKYFYKNEHIMANEWKLQKEGDFDSETITTIPKGETVTILYQGGPNCVSYDYVSYKDQKGWINSNYCEDQTDTYEPIDPNELEKTDDYMEYNEGKVLYDTFKEEEEAATKKSSSTSKAKDPNKIMITAVCAGGAIVLASLVTMILVNKKKKTTEE